MKLTSNIFAVLSLFSAQAFAGDTLTDAKIIGGESAPFYNPVASDDKDIGGTAGGMLSEILKANSAKPKTPVEFYPWKRAQDVARDTSHSIIPLAKNDEREKAYTLIESLYYVPVSVIVYKKNANNPKTIDEAKAVQVGVPRGSLHEKTCATENFKKINANFSSGKEMLKSLESGHISAIVDTADLIYKMAKELGIPREDLTSIGTLKKTEPYKAYLSKYDLSAM